jgi:hypothetical protein
LDVIESLLPHRGIDLHTDWIRISKAGQWVAGKPEKDFLGTVKVIEKETYRIHTFRCQNCRFLEQYA